MCLLIFFHVVEMWFGSRYGISTLAWIGPLSLSPSLPSLRPLRASPPPALPKDFAAMMADSSVPFAKPPPTPRPPFYLPVARLYLSIQVSVPPDQLICTSATLLTAPHIRKKTPLIPPAPSKIRSRFCSPMWRGTCLSGRGTEGPE